MKAIATKLIQFRNPSFSFCEELSMGMFVSFIWGMIISIIRGLKVLTFLKFPKGVSLGKKVKFKYSSKISFGKFLKVGDHVKFDALSKQGLNIGNNVSIGSFSSVSVSTTLNDIGEGIWIGNNVGIGEFAYLGGAGGLKIGDGCIVGQYFSCHPENHVYSNREVDIRLQGTERKGIEIEENCWIGSKVSILDGVRIGAGSVIAAGAVVTKSFPENSIIGGVPAKLIKTR